MSTQDDINQDEHNGSGLHPRVGVWYLVQTVQPFYHGKCVAVTGLAIHLEQASWVPDTGRLSEFVKDPTTAREVEYLGEQVVPWGCVQGVTPLPSKGPLETK